MAMLKIPEGMTLEQFEEAIGKLGAGVIGGMAGAFLWQDYSEILENIKERIKNLMFSNRTTSASSSYIAATTPTIVEMLEELKDIPMNRVNFDTRTTIIKFVQDWLSMVMTLRKGNMPDSPTVSDDLNSSLQAIAESLKRKEMEEYVILTTDGKLLYTKSLVTEEESEG